MVGLGQGPPSIRVVGLGQGPLGNPMVGLGQGTPATVAVGLGSEWKAKQAALREEARALAESYMDPALIAARAAAREGRDARRGNGEALVNLWREASKPRKGGAIKPEPAGCKLDSPELFRQWLAARGLEDALEYTGDQQGWSLYRYTRNPVVKSEKWWEQAFHGSWWYSAWLILETGIFLESDDKDLGHDYWEPGVYCSPSLDTGLWYARPQALFGDTVFHRIIFDLRVDPERRKKNRARGGIQWVFPCGAVSLHGLWVRHNAPPNNGEERVLGWEPELEALPPGQVAPEPTVNWRTGQWPHYVDPHPFVLDDNSVPPWMMDGIKDGNKATVPTATKNGNKGKGSGAVGQAAAANTPGGLYGRWLKMAASGELHPSWKQAVVAGPKGGAKGWATATKGQKGGASASAASAASAVNIPAAVGKAVIPKAGTPTQVWNPAANQADGAGKGCGGKGAIKRAADGAAGGWPPAKKGVGAAGAWKGGCSGW